MLFLVFVWVSKDGETKRGIFGIYFVFKCLFYPFSTKTNMCVLSTVEILEKFKTESHHFLHETLKLNHPSVTSLSLASELEGSETVIQMTYRREKLDFREQDVV